MLHKHKSLLATTIVALCGLWSASVFATEDIMQSAADGCKKELTQFCKDVTPGEGRILSCLAAYEDKLSDRCDYALYKFSAQLKQLSVDINHVGEACIDDVDKVCPNTSVGQGHVLVCLKKNEAKVSPACKQAMHDTHLEVH